MNFLRPFRWLTLAAAALSTTACLELEQKLVLNPDGSGKVTTSSAVAIPAGLGDLGLGGGDKKPDTKAQAREMVVAMLRAEGIEAWSDVSYGVGKDGKTRASVTGYFSDVTKVRMSNPMEDKGDKEDLGVTKNSDGNWVIEQHLDKKDKKDGKKPTAEDTEAAKKMTEEEVEEKLTAERQQWAGMKGLMSGFLSGLRIAFSVEGGGTVVDTVGFEKKGDNKASFEMTGAKMIESIDGLMQDDAKAKDLIRKGMSPTDGGPEAAMGSLMGDTMKVTLKPGQPAFDYKAEVEKAKANVSPELKSLLEDAKKPAKKNALKLNLGGGDDDGGDAPADEPKPGKKKPAKVD